MPLLSFDDAKGARPIALVKGGDYGGSILYLHEDHPERKKVVKREIPALKYLKEAGLKELKPAQRTALLYKFQEAIDKDVEPDQMVGLTPSQKELYARIRMDEKADTSITLPDTSTFHIIPTSDPKKREIFYICGASGSGKSYIATEIAQSYKKLFPGREVYLVSKLNEDPTIDKCKPKRLNVQTLVEDYPSIDEFEDCMVIFDDIDTFDGPELKSIHQLIDDIAITGRHTNTSMMFLTHHITNYKKTRLVLNEASHYIVYPQSTSYHALSYLLKTYVGMEKEDVKELRKLGRWVCVGKNYPQHLISSHTAKILHQSD